jgi:hypothetical protein
VRVAALGDQEIVGLDAVRVGDGERVGLDRLVDRPPDLNNREAFLQQLFAFVWEQFTNPVRSRPIGVIVVRREHGLAQQPGLALGLVAGAQRVVEDMDASCPR